MLVGPSQEPIKERTAFYPDKLWGSVVESFAVPSFIFQDGTLTLTFSELSVYLDACYLARRGSNARFQATLKALCKLTGYSNRQVTEALEGLRSKGRMTREDDHRSDR